ncbi:MAG: hypothetical protein KAS62_08280, partial [Candidatus Delongbacteria bacterium]|nr:hypothetical protein [Candidatus Delongbacteria bacterium]
EEIKKELERSKSFLGSLVNLFWEDSLYNQVDAKTKYENTIYAVKNFFMAKSLQDPVVIEISDGIWIDSDSSKMLEVITQNMTGHPIIIISDTRYLDDGSEKVIISNDDIFIERIKLDKLTKELSMKLIENILNPKANIDISIPKETVSFVRKKSEDNPFYIEQIILYLQKNNLLDLEYSLKDKDFEIPSSINSIIIARIDRLKNNLKKVVQTASVLGKEFNIKVLSGMLNNRDIEEELTEGKKENIWSVLTELNYLFRHALISESIYEMQLKKQLRELHKLAAETFEKLFSDEIDQYYFDIANHYYRAESIKKAIDYLFKAGVQAQNEYKNKQAIDLYDRLLKLIKRK